MSREQDLRFLRLAAEDLEAYLQSDVLFWVLSGREAGNLPRLTLGGLLLAQKRLTGEPQAQPFNETIESVLFAHRALKEKKAAREFNSRLNQWRNYLQEYRQAPARQADLYRYEVRWRVMLALLLPHLPPTIHTDSALDDLDAVLRLYFVPGDFLWDASLQSAFPEDAWWYLYGHLKS